MSNPVKAVIPHLVMLGRIRRRPVDDANPEEALLTSAQLHERLKLELIQAFSDGCCRGVVIRYGNTSKSRTPPLAFVLVFLP